MRMFGSWSELVQTIFRKDTRNITLRPSTAVTYTADRIVELPAQDAASTLVSRDSTDTLTNKTLTSPVLNSPTLNNATLKLDDQSSAFSLQLDSDSQSPNLSADRKITFNVHDANRSVELAQSLSVLGSGQLSLTTTGSTSVTLPTTGTLSTLAGTETLSNKTLASPQITTSAQFNAQAEARFADADSSNYVAFKGPSTVGSNVSWTLPSADGTTGQALTTNGTGTLSWASVATDNLPEFNVKVGDSTNTASPTNTDTLGYFRASSSTSTFSPSDVNTGSSEITITGHGCQTGDIVNFSSSGTLPAPLTANTPYYVFSVNVNTIQLESADRSRALNGNPDISLTTQGTGTHTLIKGGIRPHTFNADSVWRYPANPSAVDLAGYIGEYKESVQSTDFSLSGSYQDILTVILPKGIWTIEGHLTVTSAPGAGGIITSGISAVAGAPSDGVIGDNFLDITTQTGISGNSVRHQWKQYVNSTTTYRLKAVQASGSTVNVRGKLWARRDA